MNVTYYIRFFDAAGAMLGFEMIRATNDGGAMQTAKARQIPEGCVSVEIARENGFLWRGKATELGLSVH